MSNDSTLKTLIVALLLCIICSIAVSGAAVKLRAKQEENKKLDIQKNILVAAGLVQGEATKDEIRENYQRIEEVVIDLNTGDQVTDINPSEYDQKAAARDPSRNETIPANEDIAQIKQRAKYAKVFLVKEQEQVATIVLPIHGKGLWSTMYGFVALAPDTTTVKGFGFYQHGETPGLGGEVDNVKWKKSWVGKRIYNENFEPAIDVVKGSVDSSMQGVEHKIDGLSGATITSVGVENLVNYWVSEKAFGKYLEKFRMNNQMAMNTENTQSTQEGSL